MLMKQINYIFAFLLALFCGINVAEADVVTDYKMDFNSSISTSAHDFKVGTGWGHVVDSYDYEDDDWYPQTAYVSYTYSATSGRDGSGALKAGTQTIGSYYDTQKVNDLLVTPKITGPSSIYVKQNVSSGSIRFFTVTKTGVSYVKGSEITVDVPALSTSDWVKVDLPEQDGKYIGIRADNVLIDDFEAAQAEYERMAGLTVSTVINNGSSDPDCTPEGFFPIDFKVNLKNTGDVTLTAGMENYSLSLFKVVNNDTIVLKTIPLTETLEVGATASVNFLADLDYTANSTRVRYDIMENLTGTTKAGAWIEPVAYLPKLRMRNEKNSYFDAGESFPYGMVKEATTKKFVVCNNGAAPLVVTAIDVPDGFSQDLTLPLTIAAHKQQDMNITLSVANPGVFTGDVIIKGNDVDDFKFSVSGTVRDASKYFEDFESGVQPAGTYMEKNWKIEQRDYQSNENVYLASNSTRGNEMKFITPLLKVAEGEKMTFDAARTSASTSGDDVFLNVYYSQDRQNWTLAKTIKSSELSSTRANYNYYFGSLTTFVLDNVPAGNYYIAFGAGYTSVDNIYGFERVDVAHDLMITESAIPAVAKVNNEYEAKVTLNNIADKVEESGTYSMSLYAGDKVVATAVAGTVPVKADTTFTFKYTPHEAGTVKVYAQFKNLTDGFTLSTVPVDVTVAEETATSEKVIGDAAKNETSTNVLFYWNYADDSKGAYCDMYYPVEMLKKFGLEAGDKITGIKYVGKPTSTKDVTKVDQTLSIGLIDETTYVAGENTDALTTYELMKNVDVSAVVNKELVTDVKLTTPIVWDGTSALRVCTYVNSNDNKWMSVNYPVDKTKDADGKDMYAFVSTRRGSSDTYGTTKTYLPIATLEITGEPVAFSGTVKCNGQAVADATVTLTSGDVMYTGKTDGTGAYSFPVIQTKKTYTLTVSADNYVTYTEEGINVVNIGPKNITLNKVFVKATGKVIYRKTAVAGAEVILSHKAGDKGKVDIQAVTAEDGTYTFDEVTSGQKYSLEVYADKYNDYVYTDSIEINDAIELPTVELTKPDIKLYGTVKWGETPVAGVNVTYGRDQAEGVVVTDAEGKFEFNVKADTNYYMSAEDPNGEFAKYTDKKSFSSDVDIERNIQLTVNPVDLTVGEDGYVTFSYKRAVDFSGAAGLKAYVVTGVAKNYTELAEVTAVPANTGVVVEAAAGTYKVMPVETADAVAKNLLVAADADFAVSSANVGKAWTLTAKDNTPVFTSVVGAKVAKGGAYLGYESKESVIYLHQTDGIHSVDTSANGMLDLTKPMFNLAGQQVGKEYKGVVIQNGKKFRK